MSEKNELDKDDYKIIYGSLCFTAALLTGGDSVLMKKLEKYNESEREQLMQGILTAMSKITPYVNTNLPHTFDEIRQYYDGTKSLR